MQSKPICHSQIGQLLRYWCFGVVFLESICVWCVQALVCMGIGVYGRWCVWALVCMGISVYGHWCVWALVCMGVGVYGH